ncbi:MAG: GNAT family N-acetyltransferase [Chitinophagales bacterium]|nr:GNAT family N-acetyltransferase [Chitinophagales bacterium]
MNSKEQYRHWVKNHNLPLYLQPDWLDVVTKNSSQWDTVFSYNDKDEIQGFWVYVFKQQGFWSKLTMPPFTPYMGPRLLYPHPLNEYQRISFENKVLEDLIQQLPHFSDIQFKWTAGYENWLAFYWKGYSQQTAYTYILGDLSNLDFIFENFKDSLKRQIRKAENSVKVVLDGKVENAIQMLKTSLSADSQYLADEVLLNNLHQVMRPSNQPIILEARDDSNQLLAAIYLIRDKEEMLYLYGGYDKKYSNSGAMALLFWEAIKLAHEKELSFNFEGSMLNGVERFFRSFGAKLVPVFTLSKSKFPYKQIRALR